MDRIRVGVPYLSIREAAAPWLPTPLSQATKLILAHGFEDD
jgi:hypothetical protein